MAKRVLSRTKSASARTMRSPTIVPSLRSSTRLSPETIAGQEKTKFRGRERVGWAFAFAAAAYNLIRLPKLMPAPA
jgi:hypothetical protein